MVSQGLTYISNLSKKGVRYHLLTFETKDSLNNSRKLVSESDMPISWKYLNYHRNPRFLATFLDLVLGILTVLAILVKNKIEVIHARGFIAALTAFLPARIFGAKLFFDTRGLLSDKYVCGGLLVQDSFAYRFIRWGEDFLIRRSHYFTVETHKHAEVIGRSNKGLVSKMGVIPCCVDTRKFDYRLYAKEPKDGIILFIWGKLAHGIF